jgi:hypothetical protein
VLVSAAVAFGTALPASAQKTDVLTLYNGDVITGEIREMSQGQLTFKTDDMGTLRVQWERVERLRSVHLFEVLLADGQQVMGSIGDPGLDGSVVVARDTCLSSISAT